jgi:uracil-DNA glycosylase family 4
LREIGQDPRKFYFTNLIKCICLIREKDGIEGNPEKCYHFLQDEMRARNPNRVIILGQKAGDFIRNSNDEKLMDKLSYAPHPAARISNEEYQKRLRNALGT